MSRSIGIELTEANVKLLALEKTGKKHRVLQFYKAAVPTDKDRPWNERASEALREAIAACKTAKGRIVVSIDSGEAILREVALPFKNDDQIRKTVRFEMESLVHNYTIDDLVIAWYKTGETEKGSQTW